MSQFNPFASPQAQYPDQPPVPGCGGWIFRDGNALVVHRMAQLPDVCVKSNQPAEGGRLARRFSWHNPWLNIGALAGLLICISLEFLSGHGPSPMSLSLTIVAGLGIYAVLARILGRTATIQIGLSPAWFAKRRRVIVIGWILALVAVGLFVGGLALVAPMSGIAPWLVFFSFPTLVVGGVLSLFGSRMVRASRITDQYVWLKGCHPDFLARFPNWPY